MQCPKCGFENKPNAVFCASCGVRIQNAGQTSQTGSYSKPAVSPSASNKTQIVQSSPSMLNQSASEVLIGRAGNCDVVINDGGVSSKHARIFVENEELFIEDLRSLNGTFVNGRRVGSKVKINARSRINIGNQLLSMNHPAIYNLINKYGLISYSDSGILSLKVNQNWVGKIFYFIMIVLFFFPWLSVKAATLSFSFSALDFAFNKLKDKGGNIPSGIIDYGPLNTLFLSLFIMLIIGLFLNFLKLRITDKLNWVNILSLVILILSGIYMYLISTLDDLAGGFGALSHTFGSYMFIFICFISMFEGLIEYYISQNKNY